MTRILISRPIGRCLFAASLLLMLVRSAAGQITSWPMAGAAFTASPAEVTAAAAKIAPEKFAEVTVLFEEEKYVLDAAGRVTNTHHLIYRIETAAGVESWSEASVEWEAFYQKEPRIRARVVRGDGSVLELDQKTLTDVPARNDEDGTYSQARIHKAPLPGLNVGAIVEQETTLSDAEPLFSGGGVYRVYFERDVPIIRTRLVVEAPVGLPLEYRLDFLPEVAVQKEEAGGVRRLIFDQGHLAPSVNSDIGLATHVLHAPWVEFATGKSWSSVVAAYRDLAEPQIQVAQVKSLIGGVTAPVTAESRLALIQTLVSRLHKEVRYTGIEFGEAKLQPQTPAEILKRHYGDCKDKAALLVAMLRAAGIPANLALLDSGPGRDVTPDLPGMNQFDHAIVYVPGATAGDKPLWIDATAEFTRVGDLPYMDQGRLALVIADGTQALTQIPEARPEDSVLTETREFLLADYGPAHVIETSRTTGHIDTTYRSDYGEVESKEQKTQLENYAKSAYASKGPPTIEHGDPRDLNKPFVLKLDMAQAKRGNTGIKDAAVAIFPTGTYSSLPKWFGTDPDQSGDKLTAEEEADRHKAELQRSPEYDVQPFIAERRYVVTPPAGFVLRALPAAKTTQMGPATLTEAYSADGAGVVTAVLRFNSGKPRYTADEALALRKAVLAANKEDAVMLYFDQAGAKLVAAGKVREGLAADQAVLESHPKEAMPHIRLAYALLEAGLGEKARAEATLATKLDAKSALAFSTLGWIAQFDSIGERFRKGFDLAGALAAFRRAKELGPEDVDTRENLAILYEYDAQGVRYASAEGLKSAIREYRDLKTQDKAEGERFQDNILFDLLYSQQYKELLAEIAPLPATATRNSLSIAATVALDGVDAGIKRADGLAGDATQRSTALRNAGAQLINLRLYGQAAEVLSAGIEGQENATAIARQIEIFRNLKPFDMAAVVESKATDKPEAVVQRMIALGLSDQLSADVISRLLSHHAFATDAEWQANLKKSTESAGSFRAIAERSGLTPDVLADVTLGSMKMTSQGDDGIGYRVTMQSVGSKAQQFYVDREEGGYRIIASYSDTTEVGNAALYFLHHGNEAAARALLDWKRELVHRGGGDDVLEGPLLPRFWTAGESKGAEAIELAAASLLTSSAEIGDLLPAIAARRDKWTAEQGKPDRTDLNLLLAQGYFWTRDGANLRKAGDALLAENPDSITAARWVGFGDWFNHDWAHWNAMLDGRLAKHPSDRELLTLKAFAAEAEGDFAAARKVMRKVLDGGEATGNDYNGYSWNTLFEGKVDADAVQAAQQANMLSKNSSFADLHTLACLYAAVGKTTEAKQELLAAMAAGNLGEPNSATWFGFGAIYEQYGVTDAAITAFRRVEKPEGPMMPTDTYVLAQMHLKALKATD